MLIYKIGKIVHVRNNYIILESNYSGDLIYVANSSRFIKDEIKKVYIFNHSNEYSQTSYGFDSFKEKIFFDDLISVPGIGPKTAMSILENGWENVMKIISEGNWTKLSKMPYISLRNAKQIVLEFQSKYQKFLNQNSTTNTDEMKESNFLEQNKNSNQVENTLKVLGFKKNQIDYAISQIKLNDNVELMVEEAIKTIALQNNLEKRIT